VLATLQHRAAIRDFLVELSPELYLERCGAVSWWRALSSAMIARTRVCARVRRRRVVRCAASASARAALAIDHPFDDRSID
jgi:hypothetical protein